MNERRTSVASDPTQMPILTRFLQEFWSAAELPQTEALTFELALEEVFMNVVMHGASADHVPRVEVCVALGDGALTLTVEDDGPAFDPLSVAAPDVTASLDERRVGGLGVFLVRRMMDSVSYHRVGTRNQLRMTKQVAR